jgi:hypothetical protein
MGQVALKDVKTAVIFQHEGVIADTVEVSFNNEKVESFKNCKEFWRFLFLCSVRADVRVERQMWSGDVHSQMWVGSPSFNCRFTIKELEEMKDAHQRMLKMYEQQEVK